jgi:PP-loop superfamily ATP-utilizing enzyme
VTHLNSLGYKYVALDLTGYRIGSLNEVLNLAAREGQNG